MQSHLTEKIAESRTLLSTYFDFSNINIESLIKYTTSGSDIQSGLCMMSIAFYSDEYLIHMLMWTLLDTASRAVRLVGKVISTLG